MKIIRGGEISGGVKDEGCLLRFVSGEWIMSLNNQVSETEYSPEEQEVLTEFHKARGESKGPVYKKVLLLICSFALFAVVAKYLWNVESLGVLALVLIIHEAGHAAGMRILGFSNISMFFLPGFGAAVSGRKRKATSWENSIVVLLGPLPGLYLAVVLFFLNFFYFQSDLIATTLSYLAVVNLFNLLPIMPLDGGRLFNYLLFSRNVYLEAAFAVIGSLVVAALAFHLEDYFFGVFAFFILIMGIQSFKIGKIRKEFKGNEALWQEANEDPSSEHVIVELDHQIREAFKEMKAKARAIVVIRILDGMGSRKIGAARALVLLTLYFSPGLLFALGYLIWLS